jgi:F0F1-type ATP synthase membrane subunit b/b'
MTTNVFIPDAWRAAQEPEAITEAVRIGEQITTLLAQAAILIERACQNVEAIIENANLGCQQILDRLTRETTRLTPVLSRLRAANKAVRS